jgi:hypothetical protein
MEENEQHQKLAIIGKSKQHPRRLTEEQIKTFGEIFPGFDVWYREQYDEDGNLRAGRREWKMRGDYEQI